MDIFGNEMEVGDKVVRFINGRPTFTIVIRTTKTRVGFLRKRYQKGGNLTYEVPIWRNKNWLKDTINLSKLRQNQIEKVLQTSSFDDSNHNF